MRAMSMSLEGARDPVLPDRKSFFLYTFRSEVSAAGEVDRFDYGHYCGVQESLILRMLES